MQVRLRASYSLTKGVPVRAVRRQLSIRTLSPAWYGREPAYSRPEPTKRELSAPKARSSERRRMTISKSPRASSSGLRRAGLEGVASMTMRDNHREEDEAEPEESEGGRLCSSPGFSFGSSASLRVLRGEGLAFRSRISGFR